jgi:hypothetical protein
VATSKPIFLHVPIVLGLLVVQNPSPKALPPSVEGAPHAPDLPASVSAYTAMFVVTAPCVQPQTNLFAKLQATAPFACHADVTTLPMPCCPVVAGDAVVKSVHPVGDTAPAVVEPVQ